MTENVNTPVEKTW